MAGLLNKTKKVYIIINKKLFWGDRAMRYLIITRRHIYIFVSLVVSVAILSTCTIVALAKGKRMVPIYNVQTDKKVVALSFDAAWGNEDTEQLIEILGKYNIKATFFVVGSWVDKYPESVKQLSDAGHEIQNHSNSHPHMPQLSTEKMISELKVCNEKIANITGKQPILFRAPYGDYNNAMLENVSSLGMYTIQWDIDSRDWMEGHTADRIVSDVSKNAKSGSIILFHNAAVNTPAALPRIIENLKNDGYSFLPVSELIYKNNYTINHAGTQIPNSGGSQNTSSSVSGEEQTSSAAPGGEQGVVSDTSSKKAGDVKPSGTADNISSGVAGASSCFSLNVQSKAESPAS